MTADNLFPRAFMLAHSNFSCQLLAGVSLSSLTFISSMKPERTYTKLGSMGARAPKLQHVGPPLSMYALSHARRVFLNKDLRPVHLN
ncbi:hypothetical protein H5410_011224 [Solanum commersonii]|uniref:Uncharacterized protein n=1 Tax=Solanum commersonii TaxID=4109 RepID=A0A9J6AN20_SOLCO|nr:hypothetical protein H5410_011224 [Solanum commersonii]